MIDNKTKERVLELHEQGLNKKEIAGSCKISYSSVGRILNESEDYEPELDYQKDSELGVVLTNQFLDEGYDLENEAKRLMYELIVLSGNFKITSFDYLKDQIAIVKRYQQLEGDPLKIYDFNWDISHNMDLIADSFDVKTYFKLIENFIDREIYLEDLESKIEEVENEYEESKDKVKKSKEELVKIQKEVADARSYKNQITKAFLFNAEGEKLKKVILEKENTIKRLEKSFIEKKDGNISEFNKEIEDLKGNVKEQEITINALKEVYSEFLESSPEIKEFWNEYTNKLKEKVKEIEA